MQHGELAGNRGNNAMIYQCFDVLEERDARIFAMKFRDQREDAHQVMHTFRELLAGAFVAGQGFRPQYEPNFDSQTPDWRFVRAEDGRPFIMDVVNFHLDKTTENEQEEVFSKGSVWVGWLSPNTARLYASLQKKAAKYKRLVEEHQCPYVVGMYPS